MSSIAIVGGHGQIARHLITHLVDAGHQPIALVRNEDHRDELESHGAQVRLLDIEKNDVDGFVAAFEGADAVVFAAGGGGDGSIDRKKSVDYEGSRKSVDAAVKAGIGRFVQISAIGVDEPLSDDTDDVWRAYVEAKRDADAYLRDTDLDWTIIRPGKLTDKEGAGRVALSSRVERGEVAREDVALTLAAVLDSGALSRKQVELVAGDTPIMAAVTA